MENGAGLYSSSTNNSPIPVNPKLRAEAFTQTRIFSDFNELLSLLQYSPKHAFLLA